MTKRQGCSWLLETGKICIDRNTLLFMFMHYCWHGCLNLLTSYYSNDPVSNFEFPAIVLNLKIDSTIVVYHCYRQWVYCSANQNAGFVKPSMFILKCDIILCDVICCMDACTKCCDKIYCEVIRCDLLWWECDCDVNVMWRDENAMRWNTNQTYCLFYSIFPRWFAHLHRKPGTKIRCR